MVYLKNHDICKRILSIWWRSNENKPQKQILNNCNNCYDCVNFCWYLVASYIYTHARFWHNISHFCLCSTETESINIVIVFSLDFSIWFLSWLAEVNFEMRTLLYKKRTRYSLIPNKIYHALRSNSRFTFAMYNYGFISKPSNTLWCAENVKYNKNILFERNFHKWTIGSFFFQCRVFIFLFIHRSFRKYCERMTVLFLKFRIVFEIIISLMAICISVCVCVWMFFSHFWIWILSLIVFLWIC